MPDILDYSLTQGRDIFALAEQCCSGKVRGMEIEDNPIILSKPRRATSGVDVLSSNWFESAVVKISGMPDHQLNEFDNKVAFVLSPICSISW